MDHPSHLGRGAVVQLPPPSAMRSSRFLPVTKSSKQKYSSLSLQNPMMCANRTFTTFG